MDGGSKVRSLDARFQNAHSYKNPVPYLPNLIISVYSQLSPLILLEYAFYYLA